jgi:fructose-bisphosphate aldolase class 1
MNSSETVYIPATVGDKTILVAATPVRRNVPAGGSERQVSIGAGGTEREVSINVFPDLGAKMPEVWATIASFSASMAERLSTIKAKKVAVEFGIEIAIESGQLTALLAKGSATTSLKITIEWE